MTILTTLLLKSSSNLALVFVLLFSSSACLTHRHSVARGPIGAQGSTQVYAKMKQGFLFWGLIPLQKDNLELPQHGDYQIKTSFNVEDGLISLISCGIISYRTIKILEYKQDRIEGVDFRIGDKVRATHKDKLILGEIMGIDGPKKRVSYLHWNIYGEKCLQSSKPASLEAVSEQSYRQQMRAWREEIQRYKYQLGDQAIWPMNDNTEFGIITKLDNRQHKADIELTNIYNEVVYLKVPYLDIKIIDNYEYAARLEDWKAVKRDYIFETDAQVRWEYGKEKYRDGRILAVLSNRQVELQYTDEKGALKTAKVNVLNLSKGN